MRFGDFYDIAVYGSENWNGNFTLKEIAQNAYTLFSDFEWSKANGKIASSILTLLSNLDEDVENGETSYDVLYWRKEIRKELKLNNVTI